MASKIKCQFTGCEVEVSNDSEAIALAMFQSHMLSHSNPVQTTSQRQRLPPIPRPEIKQDITEEDWVCINAEWSNFKSCAGISDDQLVNQLYQCCEKSLARLIIREQPDVLTKGEAGLLAAIKRFAVVKIATSVRRTNLLATRQTSGQSIREFYANIKAAAAVCQFRVKCKQECCKDVDSLVDYTANVVKDVLLIGIADEEIRKDILSWEDLDKKSDQEVVDFAESKELAQAAFNSSSTTSVSSNQSQMMTQSLKAKLALKGKCAKCNKEIPIYKRYDSGKINKKAFKLCAHCYKESKQTNISDNSAVTDATASSALEGFFVTGILDQEMPIHEKQEDTSAEPVASVFSVTLGHHIFTPEGWQRVSSISHPTLRLRLTTSEEDYTRFGLNLPKIAPKHVDVVTDSGAQSCLMPRKMFHQCGFAEKDLIPVRHLMKAANRAPISIDGAIFLRLSGSDPGGEIVEAAVMAYVSPDANNFYLSREAMIQLRIIDESFPQVGATPSKEFSASATSMENESVANGSLAECGCLKREPPPSRPAELPIKCSLENAEEMRQYLLNRYKASTFNKCPHQELPKMEGPPIQIHIDPNAIPVKFTKPVPVALHWQKQVEEDLERDIALGVLERVPLGEPTKWCFKMLIQRKEDGSPRRTIDISPMNKHCEREVHTSKSPFTLARSIPENTVKTVFDAWNGYHALPVREEDRHLLTFSTSIGLLRCKRAPQGFLSSGDGYNRRYDDLTRHIQRMERCVDDSLLHDNEEQLEDHWWRVMDYIELCGNAGIVLNPEKFQFSQTKVNFAGFHLTKNSVEPLPKYLNAIRNFPAPKNITDIRSWFGLVNQLSHYSQLRDMMAPFRKFLSPKEKFTWSPELDTIFEESKSKIIDAIKEGVKIFDISRRTCLRTDWSKKGIGYFLSQKHCKCIDASYGCCPDGWKVTLAGSRFLSKEEKNYVPIEGEALAVVWALEQTRYFTMGCNDLLIIVDHKPLVKIFGDRRLDEIDNPRLFRLKQRTLMWRFEVQYQKGADNPCADAMSRYPNAYAELASAAMMSEFDLEEAHYVGGVLEEAEKFFRVTWDDVKSETNCDNVMIMLKTHIADGFPETKGEMASPIRCFWEVRDGLRIHDGVILYKDRIVIPASLRTFILGNLHSAHQGTSGMYSRAQSIVFWPNMSADLESARESCRPCDQNAPSQTKMPPTAPNFPTTPFQMIFADYLELSGKHYLIIGDRLSGWTEVMFVRKGTATSGSKGLCNALRKVFSTFGVSEEISSDGGPEFVSREAQDFFQRWRVTHRLSSAYFPQSNGRAEVAVKMTKRLLRENTRSDGSLDADTFVKALLQYRNTPDRECKLSPAEILFGRNLPDSMPQLVKDTPIFESKMILGQWHHAWAAKEQAIKSRLIQTCRQLEPRSRELLSLREGDQVLVQNQNKSNTRFNKWDQQGTVIALNDKDQCLIKIHGSGRVTLRNRRFVKKFKSLSGFNTKAWPRSMPVADNQSGVSKEVKPHQLATERADPELHDGNDQLPGVNDAEMNSRLITEAANQGLDDDQLPVAEDQNQEPMVTIGRQPSITPDDAQQSLSFV